MKPICYDLFCGLDGWGEAFLSEGYEVIGYDIVDMAKEIGTPRAPGLQLVLRDVRSIHGSELKDATCIVASPPCQGYSYRAMPWKRAKALPPPDNELFNACFRIQREAIQAAGHHIPLIVENVRGAQRFVGSARWHFGSFYLWGDVPALMPAAIKSEKKTDMPPVPLGTMYRETGASSKAHITGTKREGFRFDVEAGRKVPGLDFSKRGGPAFNSTAAKRYREGVKQQIPGNQGWFGQYKPGCQGTRNFSSKSDSRKAASAMIAKIPFPLAVHIARAYKPHDLEIVRA